MRENIGCLFLVVLQMWSVLPIWLDYSETILDITAIQKKLVANTPVCWKLPFFPFFVKERAQIWVVQDGFIA